MKKLIIAGASLVLTLVANAASVTWGANSIAFTSDQTDATKYTAYLIDNTYAQYSDAAAAAAAVLANGASASGVIKSLNGTANNSAVAFSAAKSTLDNEPTSYAGGDKIDLYMVVLDGSVTTAANYMTAFKSQASFNTSLNLTAAFGSLASNTWTAVAVPEPTSGLLMFLGMAGLALRRKRT